MTTPIKTLSEGQAKDLILEYALENQERTITAHEINRQVFPHFNEDEIMFLFEKIQNTVDKVADVRISEYNCLITATGITKLFLEQGGFTKTEIETIKEKQKQLEKEKIEFEKSKIDLELAKKMLKEYPYTKWFARIGFIIALVLGVIELIQFYKG